MTKKIIEMENRSVIDKGEEGGWGWGGKWV